MSEKLPRSGPLEHVRDEELACLVMWPDGTVGHHEELRLLRLLNRMCKRFGYGRVPQLAKQLEDLWNHPEKQEAFAKARESRLAFLEDCRREVEEMDNGS